MSKSKIGKIVETSCSRGGEKLIQTHIEDPDQERIEPKEMGGAQEDDHYVTRSGRYRSHHRD